MKPNPTVGRWAPAAAAWPMPAGCDGTGEDRHVAFAPAKVGRAGQWLD